MSASPQDAALLEPPIADNVDLRGFRYMPLDIERLKRSRAWLECKARPEMAFYLVNLWTAAWHAVPAGSLEDDDLVLADLAQCTLQRWRKIRGRLLRGWFKCGATRLYNPTLCELALDAWDKRTAYQQRTADAREAKRRKRLGLPPISVTGSEIDPVTGSATASITDTVTALKGREGKGLPLKPPFSDRGRQGGTAPASSARPWHLILPAYRRGKPWSVEAWGPPPGHPGCSVPDDLLEPHELAAKHGNPPADTPSAATP